MLIAGASSTPAMGGAFTFAVSDLPSDTWGSLCSAFMLLAGASADDTSSYGGALTFNVDRLPWWDGGSAPCWCGR